MSNVVMSAIPLIRRRLCAVLRDQVARDGNVAPVLPGADGEWPDVDYQDRSAATWSPSTHLQGLISLACRAGCDPAARDAAFRALELWLVRDPRSDNWWHNQIGTPIALGGAATLLDGYLTSDQRRRIAWVLSRSRWEQMTGQNALWVAQAKIRRGLLTSDPHLLADAFARSANVLVTTTGEGIQPDQSFHQHGAQLYSGGYGHAFACDAIALVALAAGTPFAFTDRALGVLTDCLLDGQRWMMRDGRYDLACQGRESSRPGAAKRAHELARAVRALAGADAPRRTELLAFAARLAEADRAPVVGVRYFWRSDYLAVHRRRWSASVKTSSTRTVLPESGNGEGLRNWHVADGLCLLQRSDRQAHELAPVWDWRRLPGTTTEPQAGPDPMGTFGLDGQGNWITGGSSCCGGVADGNSGLAAMQLRKDGISACKAWFFFEDEYVALGAGIEAPRARCPVQTTIEQTTCAGQVEYATAAGRNKILTGERSLPDVRWVYHNSVGYLFPYTAAVGCAVVDRTGSWADISRSQSTDPIHEVLFSLWVDHGQRPTDGGYAYVVIPDTTPAELAARADMSRLAVLTNTAHLQAVWHRELGIVQAVFHQPGVLRIPEIADVEVDRPVLIQLSEQPLGLRIAVASALGQPGTAIVRLGFATGGRLDVRIELPGEGFAGQTTTAICSPPRGFRLTDRMETSNA
ncbi:polysaccharide lyase family 8 super-sandwich domain-containing protein [Kribbella caucasensis]|nr:polysaccharide lyase family 8 super-sandwich domain-containing protein [Kribbella sp. VKM Ac-2527]